MDHNRRVLPDSIGIGCGQPDHVEPEVRAFHDMFLTKYEAWHVDEETGAVDYTRPGNCCGASSAGNAYLHDVLSACLSPEHVRLVEKRSKPGCHYGLIYLLGGAVAGFNPAAGQFNWDEVERVKRKFTEYRHAVFLPHHALLRAQMPVDCAHARPCIRPRTGLQMSLGRVFLDAEHASSQPSGTKLRDVNTMPHPYRPWPHPGRARCLLATCAARAARMRCDSASASASCSESDDTLPAGARQGAFADTPTRRAGGATTPDATSV